MADILSVAELMGSEDPKTTKIYTTVKKRKLRYDRLVRRFDSPSPLNISKEDLLAIVQAFLSIKNKSNKSVIDAVVSLYFEGCKTE